MRRMRPGSSWVMLVSIGKMEMHMEMNIKAKKGEDTGT